MWLSTGEKSQKNECSTHLPCNKQTLKQVFFMFLSLFVTVEALHLGTLMAAHGYFFPISDHVLTLKDDGTFYRFQVSNISWFY